MKKTKEREALQKRALDISQRLARMYPEAKCSLDFRTPYQLLVATILSAQCTDERVNMVTPSLFLKYPDPAALAKAPLEEIGEAIKTTGFYNNKAKSLKAMATMLVQSFGGKVPKTLEELTQLAGVGRKTANVVLGNCFGTPGITVDTHVSRVSQRLGLTAKAEAEKIEADLSQLIPQPEWTRFSHRMIYHGRAICQARKPLCGQCDLRDVCQYFQTVVAPSQQLGADVGDVAAKGGQRRGRTRRSQA